MGERWYFAYGSNLDVDQMAVRTGTVGEARRARLAGYRVCFNKLAGDGSGKANMVPDETRLVWGVAYRCDLEALEEMDRYEGVHGGHYVRKDVRVTGDSGETFMAVTYVAGDDYLRPSLVPASDYLTRIVVGARYHRLPESYIDEILQAAQTLR